MATKIVFNRMISGKFSETLTGTIMAEGQFRTAKFVDDAKPGSKYAFSKETMRDENNVVMRLNFKLRGSATKGDVYELSVADAVFAATDEEQSLSSVAGTLRTQNGKVVVGGAK